MLTEYDNPLLWMNCNGTRNVIHSETLFSLITHYAHIVNILYCTIATELFREYFQMLGYSYMECMLK